MELYREVESLGIPVLFVNSYYKELAIPHISMDDRRAGYLAAKHLAECGHTRIRLYWIPAWKCWRKGPISR